MSGLEEFARREKIRSARFSAIGAFQSATLAYFDWETKDYVEIPVPEQVEVLVLAGDIAWKDNEPVAHAQVVLGPRDGATIGGHLCNVIVRASLELMQRSGRTRPPLGPAKWTRVDLRRMTPVSIRSPVVCLSRRGSAAPLD